MGYLTAISIKTNTLLAVSIYVVNKGITYRPLIRALKLILLRPFQLKWNIFIALFLTAVKSVLQSPTPK